MPIRNAFGLLLIAAFPLSASAQLRIVEPIKFETYFSDYYLDKDTEELMRQLQELEKSKDLDEHESGIDLTVGFLAGVFTDKPDSVERLAKCCKFTGKAKTAIQTALWLSGNAEKIKSVFGDSPKFAQTQSDGLKKMPIKTIGDINRMWGAFSATGKSAYVKRVLDACEDDSPMSGDKKRDDLARNEAKLYLMIHMMHHEIVYRVVREEAKVRAGKLQALLKEYIKAAKPKGKLEHKDGDFSAMLFLMKEESLKEFDKSVDEALQLKSESSARRGEKIGIKVVFAGIKLARDFKAHVDYDLKVLDPDGQPYDQGEIKNLEGLNRKVPTRFRVFDNLAVPMIEFEPKDKPGTYKVHITLRDRIGNKSVKMEREIELKP